MRNDYATTDLAGAAQYEADRTLPSNERPDMALYVDVTTDQPAPDWMHRLCVEADRLMREAS